MCGIVPDAHVHVWLAVARVGLACVPGLGDGEAAGEEAGVGGAEDGEADGVGYGLRLAHGAAGRGAGDDLL